MVSVAGTGLCRGGERGRAVSDALYLTWHLSKPSLRSIFPRLSELEWALPAQYSRERS